MDWLPHPLRKIISTCLKWYLLWRQAFFCVRMSVRPSRWSTPPHLNEAIKDLQPRPADEGALSVYIVFGLDSVRIQKEVATSILSNSGHTLKRWTKREVQRLAAPLLKQKAIRRKMTRPDKWS